MARIRDSIGFVPWALSLISPENSYNLLTERTLLVLWL